MKPPCTMTIHFYECKAFFDVSRLTLSVSSRVTLLLVVVKLQRMINQLRPSVMLGKLSVRKGVRGKPSEEYMLQIGLSAHA